MNKKEEILKRLYTEDKITLQELFILVVDELSKLNLPQVFGYPSEKLNSGTTFDKNSNSTINTIK